MRQMLAYIRMYVYSYLGAYVYVSIYFFSSHAHHQSLKLTLYLVRAISPSKIILNRSYK